MNWIQRWVAGDLILRLTNENYKLAQTVEENTALMNLAKETIGQQVARISSLQEDLENYAKLRDEYNTLIEEHTKFVEQTTKAKTTRKRTKKVSE